MPDILVNRRRPISFADRGVATDTLTVTAGEATSAFRAYRLSAAVFALRPALLPAVPAVTGHEHWRDLLTGDEVDVADLFGAFA
ncbi:hypothetical protein [Massilia sp. METH4]|uniref:hypothetical protein n=1 Tax=Massilia sp. METH4 TaxID=3123041 RepID=UPI0030CDDB0C